MAIRSSEKDVSQQNQRIFSFDWYRTLPEQAAHAFWTSFMGWALDAFDFQVFSLALTAIAATFALSKGQSGLIATVTLVVSAIGGVMAGTLADRIDRRATFVLFAISSAALIVLYTQIPVGANVLLLVLGVPLGFFASGIFSGFGSYLAELYPSRARGAGRGFTYNFGRAVGAFFPAIVGFLSASIGLVGAVAFGALAYGLCLLALIFLPETKGKAFVALD